LDEHGIGVPTGHGHVPIVPAAVIFDLGMVRPDDLSHVRPTAETGYAACINACSERPNLALGNVGAGAGATVGKLFGAERSMKGGLGEASVAVGPWVVSAVVVCNAVGDVLDPATGVVIAGLRTASGVGCAPVLADTQAALLLGQSLEPQNSVHPLSGANTTIGVLATNANLSKAQAKRLAMSGHDGLARAIRPAHTPFDGDALFCLATGDVADAPNLMLLNAMAAEAVARAIVKAVLHARGVHTRVGWIPAARDLRGDMSV
jgi:L-aminopeptidase/D-esterase-like protein